METCLNHVFFLSPSKTAVGRSTADPRASTGPTSAAAAAAAAL